ncbi:hypothetical protein JXA85_04870 [Candidatus Woesearchaeota archaeon]|nr:hypothetical protein [Candidatus Woesearchaeota archaeon]
MCAIIGVSSNGTLDDVVLEANHLLKELDHRAQDGAGICAMIEGKMILVEGKGKVEQALTSDKLKIYRDNRKNIYAALAQARYITSAEEESVQPVIEGTGERQIALIHNGNIRDYAFLKSVLRQRGVLPTDRKYSDSELIAKIIASSKKETVEEAILETLELLKDKPAHNLIVQHKNTMYAYRDRYGHHPLDIGWKNGTISVASEKVALQRHGYQDNNIEDIKPGQFIKITKGHIEERKQLYEPYENKSWSEYPPSLGALCFLEFVYFMTDKKHHESGPVESDILLRDFRIKLGSRSGYEWKRKMLNDGREIPQICRSSHVPRASKWQEFGHINQTGDVHEQFIRIYAGDEMRAFIARTWEDSIKMARQKFRIQGDLYGKSTKVNEDTDIKGTNLSVIIELLRAAGVSAAHIVVNFPPIKYTCPYGFAFQDPKLLIAYYLPKEEQREEFYRLIFMGMLADTIKRRDRIIEVAHNAPLTPEKREEAIEMSVKLGDNYIWKKKGRLYALDKKIWLPENYDESRFSLFHLPLESLLDVVGLHANRFCYRCLTGKYPENRIAK